MPPTLAFIGSPGRAGPYQLFSDFLHVHCGRCTHVCMYTHTHNVFKYKVIMITTMTIIMKIIARQWLQSCDWQQGLSEHTYLQSP